MPENYIEKLELTNFTAFDHIELDFCPGINVFIGTNGTGKTHILKILYSQRTNPEHVVDDGKYFLFKQFVDNFMLGGDNLGRLVRNKPKKDRSRLLIHQGGEEYKVLIDIDGNGLYDKKYPVKDNPVYIPPKEILTHSVGFESLYEQWNIRFEKIYIDIIKKATHPTFKKPFDDEHSTMLQKLDVLLVNIEEEIGGRVVSESDGFYVVGKYGGKYGKLEFSLLAEGYSKLGLLWQLIRNGSLAPGATLFWDEPETNLNPELMKIVAKVLMVLQRHNIQVFLATHSYIMLKEIDLAAEEGDSVKYHKLFKDNDSIKAKSSLDMYGVFPNVINDTYLDVYERDLDKGKE